MAKCEQMWWRRGAEVLAYLPGWWALFNILDKRLFELSFSNDPDNVDCAMEQMWADENKTGINEWMSC